jgi:starvation-inducible DNA-binding protein
MEALMHVTKNSMPEKNRIELVFMLNRSLASTNDLYIQLKQAHWNIKGATFIAVHKLLDEIAEHVENQVDIIAERITSLGGTALGTLQKTLENSNLRIYPIDIFKIEDHIMHLTHNIAILAELTRTNIKRAEMLEDMVTSDMYIGLTQVLDHNLWFLEAHLQK